ncbi:MAG: endonuclease MutS2 [Clostridia bacterium]|nr:endonuclease MutS2 [Clostridia bacterium]
MNSRVLRVLEYDKIMQQVASFAQSEQGKRELLSFVPTPDLGFCRLLLAQTAEADELMYAQGVHPGFGVDSIEEPLALSAKGSMLSMADLLKIARALRVSSEVKHSISRAPIAAPLLKKEAAGLFLADDLEAQISLAILSDSDMSDSASPKLASIRNAIRRGNERLKEKLQSLVTDAQYAPYLQDALVTKRGDRYVIPVRAENKSRVKGLIHDRSASGQTLYIEPLAIVEMNNELRELAMEEAREIERILRDFSAKVGLIAKEIAENCAIIVRLDVIFSRAIYGHTVDGTQPLLNDQGILNIRQGRHPLIEKHKVVPIDMRLGKDFDVLLVTGPNTGGKTVTLKLTGLMTLMGMSGLFLPVGSNSEISIFEEIFCDIGDEQSIEQNLSTFSSHMSHVVEMVDGVRPGTLALIDELGSGTDPEQGAALAVHITDYILHSGAKAVITTHYGALKEFSYATERAENACMDFDPESYEPLYRLIIGIPGTSNAFEIAARLGLKDSIVKSARGQIAPGHVSFEEVLIQADHTRRQAEEQKERYEQLNRDLEEQIRLSKQERNRLSQQVERLQTNARREVKRLVDLALTEVNEIVDELKKMLDEPTKANYFEATKLRKKLNNIRVEDTEEEDIPDTTDEAPQVGDKVYVGKFHDVATLTSITKGGEYIVTLGNMKSIVRKNDIRKLRVQKEEKPTPPPRRDVKLNNAPTKRELYLLGCTADEGVYRLSKFLDEARVGHVQEVKIIHGIGTGILRAAIWEYLNTADILSYRAGKGNEGGQGVTFVRLS